VQPRVARPRTTRAVAASATAALVNITWRQESLFSEPVVPSVSLTRSRDGSTGTATFSFQRPKVLALDDVWDNGLITGLWLHDEEGQIHSPDVSVRFTDGRPTELVAILVLKSRVEWERFMRLMRRYAEANELGFELAGGDDG
jgi:photosystem II protein